MEDQQSCCSSGSFLPQVLWWVPAIVWAGVIFVGSGDLLSAKHTSRILVPLLRWLFPHISPQALEWAQFVSRKAGHVTEYGLLAVWVWIGWKHGTRKRISSAVQRLFLSWLLCVGYALLDEWHQSFVPSRHASGWDVLLDAAASLVVLVGLEGLDRLRRERAQKRRLAKEKGALPASK